MRVADLAFPEPVHAPPRVWLTEALSTLRLAWPMVLTNLGQIAMTTTDVMMMGRLGAAELAAGTLGYAIFFAPMIFGLGLLLATSPMLAGELGRKPNSVRDVRRTVRQGLWLAVAVALPLWLFLWHSGRLLLWMGQDPELVTQASVYLRSLQWSLLPFYLYIVLRSFISALERPGWALAIVFAAVLFNAFCNYCVMFGNLGFPALGLFGAGITTTLSMSLMFLGLALVVSLDRRFRRYRLFGRIWRPDRQRFGQLLRLGLPIAGILWLEVSIFKGAALMMGLIDPISLAAHAIAIQIASIAFMVPMGMGQAATVRVGRAFGAGDREGIARAGWTALALGVAFMACMALVMLVAPRALIRAFLDLSDPANRAVIELAVTFLALAAMFQIVDGVQAVGGGMLRGLHDTAVPLVYAGIGYWGVGITLGVVLAFPLGLGGVGIWIGLSAGLATVAVLFMRRWARRDRLLAGTAQAVRSPSTSST